MGLLKNMALIKISSYSVHHHGKIQTQDQNLVSRTRFECFKSLFMHRAYRIHIRALAWSILLINCLKIWY